jgi:hypothetical protein
VHVFPTSLDIPSAIFLFVIGIFLFCIIGTVVSSILPVFFKGVFFFLADSGFGGRHTDGIHMHDGVFKAYIT